MATSGEKRWPRMGRNRWPLTAHRAYPLGKPPSAAIARWPGSGEEEMGLTLH